MISKSYYRKKDYINMKIYITGILGLLGYNVTKVLTDRCEITGIDSIKLDTTSISYLNDSLFHFDKLEQHIISEKPDVLIHTAAMVNVDKCEEYPEDAQMLNVQVTQQLARICNKHCIKMIYISTDSVFDGHSSHLYTEEDGVNPINIYGKTKLDGEYAVLKSPLNLVLRTNIYGKNLQNKKSLGEWIYTELVNNNTLKMFTDIYFSPILVDELAQIIYMCCVNDLTGLYHVCSTGCISKYDFAVNLKEIFGITTGKILKSHCELMNFKAKRPQHMGMSNIKIKKALDINISTPIESIYAFYELIR